MDRRSERGAGAIEYGLIIAVLAAVVVIALRSTGDNTDQELEYTAAVIEGEVLDNGTAGASGGFGSTSGGGGVGGSGSDASQSFEDDDDRFYVVYGEGEEIGIWTVAEGSVDPFRVDQPTLAARWRDTGATAPDGEKILDLNGNEPGAIETELRVARGADYTLSFLVSENHFCQGSTVRDGNAKTGRVLWNGQEVQTFSADTDFGEFEVVTATLPASGEDLGTLRIESTSPGSCGPAIESASVQVKLR